MGKSKIKHKPFQAHTCNEYCEGFCMCGEGIGFAFTALFHIWWNSEEEHTREWAIDAMKEITGPHFKEKVSECCEENGATFEEVFGKDGVD